MGSGFILVHRSILDHWTWRSREPFTYRCAWLDLIISANWQTGHLIASYRYLSRRWKWSIGKVQRFVARMERDHMIQRATGPYSLKDRQGHPVTPWKPIHQQIQQPIHLIISNYFEFQTSRYTKRYTTRYKDKERKESPLPKGKEHRTITETHPQAIKLAHLLRNHILSENGNRKTPTDKQLITGQYAWARIFRLMIERDHREPAEIQRTIKWLYTVNPTLEACFVVLSPKSLRIKYDAIQAQMQRTGHKQQPPRRRPPSPRSPRKHKTPKNTQTPKKRPPKPPWIR